MDVRLVVAVGLLAVPALLGAALLGRPPALALEGLPKGALNAQDLRTTTVSVRTDRPGRMLLDGEVVDRTRGGVLSARLSGLADGRHVLAVEVDRGALPGRATARQVLQVDTVPPGLRVEGDRGVATDVQHLSTPETGDVEVGPDGGFRVPPGASALIAYDDAGNRTALPLR